MRAEVANRLAGWLSRRVENENDDAALLQMRAGSTELALCVTRRKPIAERDIPPELKELARMAAIIEAITGVQVLFECTGSDPMEIQAVREEAAAILGQATLHLVSVA